MIRLRRKFTYANVMSTLAVVLALAGTSYAAATIGSAQVRNNSLTSADIKNNSLTSLDIRNRSLKSIDFAPGQLPKGATGPKGVDGDAGRKGDTGEQGAAGPRGDKGDKGDKDDDGAPGAQGPDVDGASVITVRGDGTMTANAQALRDALTAASSANADAPVLVRLGAGNFDIGTTSIVVPDDVTLVGAGRHATRIIGNVVGTYPVGLIRLGIRSEVRSLTADNAGTTGTDSNVRAAIAKSSTGVSVVRDVSASASSNDVAATTVIGILASNGSLYVHAADTSGVGGKSFSAGIAVAGSAGIIDVTGGEHAGGGGVGTRTGLLAESGTIRASGVTATGTSASVQQFSIGVIKIDTSMVANGLIGTVQCAYSWAADMTAASGCTS